MLICMEERLKLIDEKAYFSQLYFIIKQSIDKATTVE